MIFFSLLQQRNGDTSYFRSQAITGETSIKIKGLMAYVVGEVDYVFGSEKKKLSFYTFSEVFIAYTCNMHCWTVGDF